MTSDVTKALKALSAQRSDLAVYYDYYRRKHALNFASAKFRNKYGARLQRLSDNLCKAVVKAPVARLDVVGFGDEKLDIGSDAYQIWKRNRLALKSKTLYRETFKTGVGYVIVWPDRDGRLARIDVQPSHSVKIWIDDETGETSLGAKIWSEPATDGTADAKNWFLTLYYPDRIEKYVTRAPKVDFPTKADQFEPREPTPAIVNPYGRVPVFKFSACDDESILEDIIPLQDALNKNFCDLMVAGEYNSLRQRFTTGIQYERDEETGKPIIPFDDDDRVWSTDEVEAKFGEFSDSDLAKPLAVADAIRQEIARVAGVPAHYFNITSGDFPSGEALKTAETRFVSLIEETQLSFGEAWADVIGFALAIEASAGIGEANIEVQWKDAFPVSESERLGNAYLKKQIGVSTNRILLELGYTETEIEAITAEAQAETETANNAIGRIFDAGASLQ